MANNICTKCGLPKNEEEFPFQKKGGIKRRRICKVCNSQYYIENKKVIQKQRKQFYDANLELFKRRNRTDKRREQNRRSKQNTRATTNARERTKRKNDPIWRLRKYLSSKISRALSTNGGGKNMSFLKVVLYTMEELKTHIESLFEPWMNWNNHGKYNAKTCDDNDSSTWTWQIDHITPQSDLPYSDMSEDNFQKCWALDNLRPLSAKQNLLDGVERTRHN